MERLGVDGYITLKLNLKNEIGQRGLDSCGLEYGQMVDYFIHR